MSKQFKATAFSYPAVYALNGFGNTEKKWGEERKVLTRPIKNQRDGIKGKWKNSVVMEHLKFRGNF